MKKTLILFAAGIGVAALCGIELFQIYHDTNALGFKQSTFFCLCVVGVIAALAGYLRIWGKVTKKEIPGKVQALFVVIWIVLGIYVLQSETSFIAIDPKNMSEITKPTYHEWMEELESGEREFENGERGSIK